MSGLRQAPKDGTGDPQVEPAAPVELRKRSEVDSKLFFEAWQRAMAVKDSREDEFSPFPDDGEGLKHLVTRDLYRVLQEAQHISSEEKGLRMNQLLKESDIDVLYKKISSIFSPPNPTSGFSLYDTKDEEGLHDGNAEFFSDHDYGQSDYDLDEVHDDLAHHIEVEVDRGASCDGHEGSCSCDEYDDQGPSCEFTFEYDHNGKLIPTSNNVEEQLRLMQLQNQQLQRQSPRPAKGQRDLESRPGKKKKNKKKKNKDQEPSAAGSCCCLFCEYEAIYGVEPRQMVKWYERTVRQEEQRRLEIKKKLEKVKHNVKRQREREQ
ncbi:hypothetical protein JA9_004756 [Meyerozyma sp. JA9]|nr:hypothetical protein JA9_004756 [Meyerozyma sp. JA9]